MPETMRKPLSFFKVSPQVRQDMGNESDLKNLGESLLVRQLSPIGAMADGELIYGFRRLKAAALVGMKDIAVTIYSEPLTPGEIKVIQLTENIHRLDMSPFEKWNAYEALRALNPAWAAKDLADHLKLDPSAVTKWLSPSKCISAWQEALRAGTVGISDCYVASQAQSEQQQREMLEMKIAGASRDALSRVLRSMKPATEADPVRSTRITVPMPCGTKIVISGKSLSLSDLVERLSECVEAARKGVKDRLDARTWQNVMRDRSQAAKGDAADV
jgi:ParB family chromosome partitioning protein